MATKYIHTYTNNYIMIPLLDTVKEVPKIINEL